MPFATLVYRDPIIYIYFEKGIRIDSRGLADIREARKKLSGNKPHPTMSVLNEIVDFTPEARAIAADPEAEPGITALAVVIKWLGQRLITDVYKKIDQPVYPTETFSDEEKAAKWLLEHHDKRHYRIAKIEARQ